MSWQPAGFGVADFQRMGWPGTTHRVGLTSPGVESFGRKFNQIPGWAL